MNIHSLRKHCKHANGKSVSPPLYECDGSISCYIRGISPPSRIISSVVDPPNTESTAQSRVLDASALDKIFQCSFRTVKSIPPSCRFAFSRALKNVLTAIVSNPSSCDAWVRLFILPACTLRVFIPRERQEKRSGNRKALQHKYILNALATWSELGGPLKLLDTFFEEMSHPPNLKLDENPKRDNVKQCLRKISDGHYSAAVKVLTSSGVAPDTPETRLLLEDKHPYASPPTLPSSPCGEDFLVINDEVVHNCIKSFPKGTSCGRDGLRAQHLLDALCGAESTMAKELLTNLTPVVNLWLQGKCPVSLAEYVASAPLTPLLKADGGVRPIAVGTIWRRLVSKVAMKKVGKEMSTYLGDFQFGVGISGGAEAILHAVSRFVEVHGSNANLSMLLVDFKNAFNMIDRSKMLEEVRVRCPSIFSWVKFLYGQPARLFLGSGFIWSACGIQQGDPLGPLLFALTLHPLILKIRDACTLSLQAWYLDDGTVIGDTVEVAKALAIIQSEGPRFGLELNIGKTEVFWPVTDPRISQDGLFPLHIGRPRDGVKLLGGSISMDDGFIKEFAKKRVSKSIELMGALDQLNDPQCELVLLRVCMGLSKLYYALRTCPPQFFIEASAMFDTSLRRTLENIVTSEGPGFGDLQWRLATLPIRTGGLGVYAASDARMFAFVASRIQSIDLQDHILRGCDGVSVGDRFALAQDSLQAVLSSVDLTQLSTKESVPPKPMQYLADLYFSGICENLHTKFDFSERQAAVFQCLRATHAQDFLLVTPIEGLGQRMTPAEYQMILRYRLMIPLFSNGAQCPLCMSHMDVYGEHAVHCKKQPGFKYRHDMVRDVLYDVLWRAGIPAKKEAPVNFLTPPGEVRSTLRPADVLVYSWDGGKHTCVDLTGVSPLCGFGSGVFIVGQAATKAAEAKVHKHDKACRDNQHRFLPFAFDTFGFLASEAVEFLRRVQKVMNKNVMIAGSAEYVFRRIGFAIQRGLAAQLVVRLPRALV